MNVTGVRMAVLVAMMLIALLSGCVAVDAATVKTCETLPALTALNLVDAVDPALPDTDPSAALDRDLTVIRLDVDSTGLPGAAGMDVEGFGYTISGNNATPVIRDLISQLP